MRFRTPESLARAVLIASLISVVSWPADLSLAQSAQNTYRIRIRLTSPVSSESTPGSLVAAQVVSPANLAGNIMEGRITSAKSNGGLKASSELAFKFEKLYVQSREYAVDGQVIGYYNSKGIQNTDDEGHIIKNSNKAVTTTAVAAGIGAVIGGILSGSKNKDSSTEKKNSRLEGAAKGAAVGAAAGLALGMTTDAPRIKFDTGSEFELDVKTPNPTRSR